MAFVSYNEMKAQGGHSVDSAFKMGLLCQETAGSTTHNAAVDANEPIVGYIPSAAAGPNAALPNALVCGSTTNNVLLASTFALTNRTCIGWIYVPTLDGSEKAGTVAGSSSTDRGYAQVLVGQSVRARRDGIQTSTTLTVPFNEWVKLCLRHDGTQWIIDVNDSQETIAEVTAMSNTMYGLRTSEAGGEAVRLADWSIYNYAFTDTEVDEYFAMGEPINSTAGTVQVQGGGDPTVGCILEPGTAPTYDARNNGTATITYRWFVNDVYDSTSATFDTTGLEVDDVVKYESRATNSGGYDALQDTESSNSITLVASATPITKPDDFRGNPYLTCSSITMGTIASSRTSCVGTPAFFHLSASAVTAVGSDYPFEDGDFRWEVISGDEPGEHELTIPWKEGSTTVDTHTDQVGPEAVFRFFQPGTKTVRLTAQFAYSPTQVIEETTDIELTVTAIDRANHYWYDPDSGNNSNDGRDPHGFAISGGVFTTSTKRLVKTGAFAAYDHSAATAPDRPSRTNVIYITGGTGVTAGLYEIASRISDDEIELTEDIGGTDPSDVTTSDGPKADTAGTQIASNQVQHFAGGNTTQHTVPANTALRNKNNCRFTSYGSGLAVIDRVNYSTASSGQGSDNHCWFGIDMTPTSAPSTTARIYTGSEGADIAHVYFSDCEFNGPSSTDIVYSINVETTGSKGFGAWNCVNVCTTGNAERHGAFLQVPSWMAIVGGSIEGGGSNVTLDHHIYPKVSAHQLYKWIDFKDGPNRNYCINTDVSGAMGTHYEYVLISECNISGTKRAWDASNSSIDYDLYARFKNFVGESNYIHGLDGDGHILFYNAESMTIRNNRYWGNTGGRGISPDSLQTALDMKIYGNRMYTEDDAGGSFQLVKVPDEINSLVFRDNILYDARTGYEVFDVDFDGADVDLDGQQIYTPNKSGNILKNDGTATTYAAYSAYDSNVSNTAPDWNDPETGDFSPAASEGGGSDDGLKRALAQPLARTIGGSLAR